MTTTPEKLTWIEVAGDTATDGVDGTSGAPYWPFALTNVRRGNVRVPTGYVTGSAIYLTILESTAGSSLRHKWQIQASLFEKDSDTTNVSGVDTFTSEVVSSATVQTLNERQIEISTDGEILGTDPAAGDMITIVLTRIAASAAEDPNDIRVFGAYVVFETDLAAISGVPGRLGTIIDHVYVLANVESDVDRPDAPMTPAKIIAWVNQCKNDVAIEQAWEQVTTMSTVASTAGYVLETAIPRYDRVDQAWWNYGGTRYQLIPFGNRKLYDQAQDSTTQTGTPEYFHIENGYIYLWPTPESACANAVELHHSYSPADLNAVDNYTPPWPVDYDVMAEYYCLWMNGLKDATGRHIPALVTQYERLYLKKKAQYTDSVHRPRVAQRPPR